MSIFKKLRSKNFEIIMIQNASGYLSKTLYK